LENAQCQAVTPVYHAVDGVGGGARRISLASALVPGLPVRYKDRVADSASRDHRLGVVGQDGAGPQIDGGHHCGVWNGAAVKVVKEVGKVVSGARPPALSLLGVVLPKPETRNLSGLVAA
jgi:hypothetical protein